MKIDSVNSIGTIGYPFGEKKKKTTSHFAQKQISDELKISILRYNKCCRNNRIFL